MIIRRFQLPLRQGLTLSTETLDTREGFWIIQDDQFAEASPLFGFSAETLAVVQHQLEHPSATSPSVQWALACLTLDKEAVKIRVNGMIPRLAIPETEELAQQLADRGYSTVKVKVSPRVELERERLDCIAKKGFSLRLDANQSLTLEQAEILVEDSPELEYLEEPLQPLKDPIRHVLNLEELTARTVVPYALDETLLRLQPEELAKVAPQLDGLSTLILKPMLLGSAIWTWIELAKEFNWNCVISSVFESPVGLYKASVLATRLPGVHGLDLPPYNFSIPVTQEKDVLMWSQLEVRNWLKERLNDSSF